jgi:hypothetical protein
MRWTWGNLPSSQDYNHARQSMATELVIEQDAALNPHVLEPVPVTRQQRLAWVKQGLLLAPIWFWGMAILVADRWMDDLPITLLPPLTGFLVLSVSGCMGVVVLLAWLDRREKGSARKLFIEKKRVTLAPRRTLPWKFIQGWHLVSVAENPNWSKLTVVYLPYPKARFTRQWSIVVTDPAQAEALRELLRQRTQAAQPGAAMLHEQPVPEAMPFSPIFIGISFMTLSFVTVVLSESIMFAGMIFHLFNFPIHLELFQSSEEGNRNLIGLFGTLAALFRSNSTYELGWALVTAGGVLLLPAFALYKLGDRQLSRKPSS